ncbi:hypothetical protein D1818_04710 [Aquimarina sp. BL5]|uniref:hypothetical protein n=1 Tax=Aquimarina sp. BL5 TaxID=1714860 RepID=UPI000E528860|nr:hypothetical protein [Aquimarina sp. BL5]AXT50165.1 hypothetical protein D1818_04710 [Aquimarina sp. BL5]RKM96346.1 hypothetical protein D7036_20885 [Aquimarina sp. BL5]
MKNTHKIKSLKKIISIIVIVLFGFQISSVSAQASSKLPDYLITKYTGVLTSTGSRTKVNVNGSCTIKTRGYRTYAFYFSDGIAPITSVKFMKNDDTYTSTIIYKGKTFAVSLDEEGDLSIGATSIGALAFSGSIENGDFDDTDHDGTDYSEDVTIETGNTGIFINGDQTSIVTGNAGIQTSNGTISIGSGDNGILIENGNVSLGTGNVGIAINSNDDTHNGSCIIDHNHNYGSLIDCGSSEISTLPKNVVGIYKGKLKTYGTETRKGICTIVKTGCKTYRLDFSNGIPSIYDVQFGRKNDFDEYASVIVEGEYSSAIEVDIAFDDLEIDGEIMRVSFDGKRN